MPLGPELLEFGNLRRGEDGLELVKGGLEDLAQLLVFLLFVERGVFAHRPGLLMRGFENRPHFFDLLRCESELHFELFEMFAVLALIARCRTGRILLGAAGGWAGGRRGDRTAGWGWGKRIGGLHAGEGHDGGC